MKWERIADKEFLMKAKVVGLLVLAAHVTVLAGFLLLQGCTTGDCPIPWLNWPYSTAREPIIVPADEIVSIPADEFAPVPMLPPPDVTAEPYGGVEMEAQVYVVQKGDTLSSIATRYGTTWKRLAEFNGLTDPNKLRAGQELRIPSSLGAPAPRPAAPAPSSRTAPAAPIKQGESYVIQKGDTLSRIASRAGISIAELKAANSLTSDRIIAGKSLTIPKKGAVSTAAAVPEVKQAVAPVAAAPAPAGLESAPAEPDDETAPVASAAAAPAYEHVLYPGETLEDVARQYGSSQMEIMKLNSITDPADVKPGTKLLVPIPE